MSSLAVMNIVTSRVAANWTWTPIYQPNFTSAVPSDNTAFLEVLFPLSTEQMYSFGATGSNYHEELGAFRISLHIPVGLGYDQNDVSKGLGLRWGDNNDLDWSPNDYLDWDNWPYTNPWQGRIEVLMSQFRAVRVNDVEFIGFVGPYIRDDSDDGAYYEISFSVSYRRMSVA